MHRDNRKYLKKSELYKGVASVYRNNKEIWIARSNRNYTYWEKECETEREAAVAYDVYIAKIGKSPVNILKPKMCEKAH